MKKIQEEESKDFKKEETLGKYMRASDIEKVEELENPKFFSKEGSSEEAAR